MIGLFGPFPQNLCILTPRRLWWIGDGLSPDEGRRQKAEGKRLLAGFRVPFAELGGRPFDDGRHYGDQFRGLCRERSGRFVAL